MTYRFLQRHAHRYVAGCALAVSIGFTPSASAAEDARRVSSHAAPSAEFGAGLFFGYQWGLPVSHSLSVGVILGDARTSGGGSSGPSYEPWPDFPGSGGRGALLQAEMGVRAIKLSAGYARAAMLYAPPVALGWAIKASYLEPHQVDETFRSAKYLGGEVEVAYGARFSFGVYRGMDSRSDTLVTWGVGVGF